MPHDDDREYCQHGNEGDITETGYNQPFHSTATVCQLFWHPARGNPDLRGAVIDCILHISAAGKADTLGRISHFDFVPSVLFCLVQTFIGSVQQILCFLEFTERSNAETGSDSSM